MSETVLPTVDCLVVTAGIRVVLAWIKIESTLEKRLITQMFLADISTYSCDVVHLPAWLQQLAEIQKGTLANAL